jgi:glycosyltransferase involved in cell wall biosynthesis
LQRKCFWRHKRGLNFASYLALAFSFYRMRDLLKNTVRKFIAPSPLLEHYLRLNQFGATVYLPPFGKPQLSPPTFTRMQPRHFLFVGQLEIQKGVDVLVEEFALACRQDTNLILKIAGSGSQENSLKQKVKDLNLEKNILFLGWIDPDKYYEECMALIFSSMGLESFGMVITETMAKGRAVIGSNRGPTTWLVEDGKSGLLFDPLIKGDLASKILLLACDTTLAQQMGEAGFQKLNIFSDQESVVDNIVSLYSSVQ